MIEIFKALSEESRLRIISLLIDKEMCVCEIEECLNMTQSNVSRHLNELKRCKILDSYKNAQWTFYQINKIFKEEHKDLFEYLQSKMSELPTYHADLERRVRIDSMNLCNSLKKPH